MYYLSGSTSVGVINMASSTLTDVIDCQINIQQSNLTMDLGLKPIEQQRMVDCYFDMSINNICRVCLEKNQGTKKMCNIFQDTKPTNLSLIIMACASVQVKKIKNV